MDARLSQLIADYQARVVEAIAILESCGYPRPSSNARWAGSSGPPHGELVPDHRFYKHGFGCAVRGPGWHVDFDFGDEGQIDGFDPSRLLGFAEGRLDTYRIESAQELDELFALARADGELVFSGYMLFYLTPSLGD